LWFIQQHCGELIGRRMLVQRVTLALANIMPLAGVAPALIVVACQPAKVTEKNAIQVAGSWQEN
jgi:hypothetical protein